MSEEIGHITAQLRALRRDLKLCARIEGRSSPGSGRRWQRLKRKGALTMKRLIKADLAAILRLAGEYRFLAADR